MSRQKFQWERKASKRIIKQLVEAFGLDKEEIVRIAYPKYYEDLHDTLFDKLYSDYEKRFDLANADEETLQTIHRKIEEEIKEEIERKIRDEIS